MADIPGTPGDDFIIGTQDDDVITAGAGNDDIFGNGGDDEILGGEGDDLINGGDGNDTMSGGAGNDQFYNLNVGDIIDGGEGGDDLDRLFLNGAVPPGGRYVVLPNGTNPENGSIEIYDANDALLGNITFINIEKIDPFDNTPPCFTPGTHIATPRGEKLVETLEVGDKVLTRDNGIREIRWIGRRDMTASDLAGGDHLRPIRIRQGGLGNDLPERDMMVSPNHRLLVASDKTALYFEEREVLVAAKYLTGLVGVEIADVPQVSYIHIMFDRHEVVLSDGCWTESFQPGDQSLAGVGNAQRQELLELFPELATAAGIETYGAARRSLKKHEARLLVK